MSKYWFDIIILWLAYISTFQSIDNVYWTEDAADEDMMNTYCWMYGHLNLPHDYMVVTMMMMLFFGDDNDDYNFNAHDNGNVELFPGPLQMHKKKPQIIFRIM